MNNQSSLLVKTEQPGRPVDIVVTKSLGSSEEAHNMSSTKTAMRPRTTAERQPYIFAYGAAISIFSPAASAYQLCRLYNVRASPSQIARLSLSIFPHQTILKAVQMNLSTQVKENLNPWAAFAVVGVLQGGVYGQSNIYFSKALQLGKVASFAGMFRGSGFAGIRDMISQGVPFVYADSVRRNIVDPVWKTESESAATVKKWASLLSTSIAATYMSQGIHNFTIAMQSDQSLGYADAVKKVFKQHGFMGLIRGGEARVGLLLIVNILNELLLKPAWMPVPAN
uniref:ADP,ATP carrier protein n=1 Tax=Corethron hystrix TaxID=216773 RepID=A0A6U5LMT7_9STRA|mmetsp:Transcript_6253/g.13553  ORF Transcript_6253/g.13553 Transcript_6253/m.13553 type:complete len:282 (+) Transcript_6253:188-1033(+)